MRNIVKKIRAILLSREIGRIHHRCIRVYGPLVSGIRAFQAAPHFFPLRT